MQHTTKSRSESRRQWSNRRISPPSLNWTLVIFIVLSGIQFTLASAWSAEISLQADNDRIKGFAHQARLGDVLGQLAEQTGYTMFLDATLLDTEVSFDIPTALPAEKAIKRIVHPHSHALVFARVPGQANIRIEQVKVFSEGNQATSYVTFTSGNGAVDVQPSYGRGDTPVRAANAASHSGVHAGPEGVRTHVRPPVEFTTNSMGFTGFKIRPRGKGVDYRPSTLTMAKAYARYRTERQRSEQRSQNNLLQAFHQQELKDQSQYQQQRTQSAQQSTTRTTP